MKRLFTLLLITILSQNISLSQYTLQDVIAEYEDFQSQKSELSKTSWPDISNEKIKGETTLLARWISALDKIDSDTLAQDNLINYEMLKFILEDRFFCLNNYGYYMPLNSEGGFIISMIYSTQGLPSLKGERRAHYIQKLENTTAYIDRRITHLEAGRKLHIGLPKLVIENCIEILNDVLEYENQFFLFRPLGQEVESSLKSDALGAFKKLRTYLKEEYLPDARNTVGIKSNSGGKEYYEQRVRYYTTLDMTPQEVFDLGQSEVKRIREEMDKIINDLEFDGAFSEFLEYLRTDEQFYVKTPEELLKHASWLSKKAEEILPRYFETLPSLPFTVNPVPADIAPNYTTGRYSGGSMDRRRAGQYWVNTYNLPARPLYVLPSLTLHEAVPGHHLQISLAKELNKELPSFRSEYLSAYGEGWGLYSEYLGKEAGMYTTPYEDFGRLTYEMWRACRLVVDPGMHYFGWTREEAVDFMAKNTSLSLHEVNTEINRYIGWPGQAVSYKIGELKIRELRSKAEKELGDDFDIRKFHDLLLANGSIPLNTLERIVNNYIKETKTNE